MTSSPSPFPLRSISEAVRAVAGTTADHRGVTQSAVDELGNVVTEQQNTVTELQTANTRLAAIESALGRTVDVSVFSGLDTNNSASVTTPLDVSEYEHVGVEVVGASGTHGTHVVAMRARVAAAGTMKLVRAAGINNVAYGDVYWQITGQNSLIIPVHGFSEVDWKVVLAEGAASTCDIHVRRWR